MSYSSPSLNEGFLIILLGTIGILRVLDGLSYAGPMITSILYTLLFIFIAIILIGIKVIRDSVR